MKKIVLLASYCAALMLSACQKSDSPADEVQLTVVATTVQSGTKGTVDYDGNAVNVNHWVLEVRNSSDQVFLRKETEPAAGTLEQTFNIKLIKNQAYKLLFWADTKGSYDVQDLTNVTPKTLFANQDTLDAFTASMDYTSKESGKIEATLTRPFAQLNIVSTDFQELWEETGGAADPTVYNSYEPESLTLTAKVPGSFNVKTQGCGDASAEIVFSADSCYVGYKTDKVTPWESNTYKRHAAPATMFMGYFFASAGAQDVVNVSYSFKTGTESVAHSFSNIPLQRNYRTNVSGKLMSDDVEVKVTIDPAWKTPENDK